MNALLFTILCSLFVNLTTRNELDFYSLSPEHVVYLSEVSQNSLVSCVRVQFYVKCISWKPILYLTTVLLLLSSLLLF